MKPKESQQDLASLSGASDAYKPRGRGRPSHASSNAQAARIFGDFVEKIELNRKSGPPLWVQLKTAMQEMIEAGSFEDGMRLPSEQTMSESFGVSRQVIRAALSNMVTEQLITKRPRFGIFVNKPRSEVGFMTQALGVHEDLSARGITVSAETYSKKVIIADDEERAALRLPEGFKVIRFVRVYTANGRPITHSVISLPLHRLPGFEALELVNDSIFQTIYAHFGLRVAHAKREVHGTIAEDRVAERLDVEHGCPLLYITSTAYDHSEIPLEYYRSHYNSDVAPIQITVGT